MIARSLWVCVGTAGALLIAGSAADARGESRQLARAEARLDRELVEALRGDGPFFNAEERALVEQTCGDAPGSWNGYEFSMTGDMLHCTNGRDVVSGAAQAMFEAAAPRIGRRVARAMAQPSVRRAMAELRRARSAGQSIAWTEETLQFRDSGQQNLPRPPVEPPQPRTPQN
jgi:hypothetical protein